MENFKNQCKNANMTIAGLKPDIINMVIFIKCFTAVDISLFISEKYNILSN